MIILIYGSLALRKQKHSQDTTAMMAPLQSQQHDTLIGFPMHRKSLFSELPFGTGSFRCLLTLRLAGSASNLQGYPYLAIIELPALSVSLGLPVLGFPVVPLFS